MAQFDGLTRSAGAIRMRGMTEPSVEHVEVKPEPKRGRFSLGTLFMLTTACAGLFALIGKFGTAASVLLLAAAAAAYLELIVFVLRDPPDAFKRS